MIIIIIIAIIGICAFAMYCCEYYLNNLERKFYKIKKLVLDNKIYYPNIEDIIVSSNYHTTDYTVAEINQIIKQMDEPYNKRAIVGYSFNDTKKFFENFKIMKVIYENFFDDDFIKPHAQILFVNSEWYEIKNNIKNLGIIYNEKINLNDLNDTIEELTIFGVKKLMINLPPTLKKLYLYNVDESINVKHFKIPPNCEVYIESYLVSEDIFM